MYDDPYGRDEFDGPHLVPSEDFLGAIDIGDAQTVRDAIDQNIDVNMVDDDGDCALTIACQGGDPDGSDPNEIISMLLQCPDINVNPDSGASPLYTAIAYRNNDALSMLQQRSDLASSINTSNTAMDITPLVAALRVGQKEVVDWLVEKGAEIDAKSNAGSYDSPYANLLRAAISGQSLECVDWVLSHEGAKEEILETSYNPVLEACKQDSLAIVDRLMQEGFSAEVGEAEASAVSAVLEHHGEDMRNEFRSHVVEPCLYHYVQSAFDTPKAFRNFISEHPPEYFTEDNDSVKWDKKLTEVLESQPFDGDPRHIYRLSDSWHHAVNTFPDHLQPLLSEKARWEPLVEGGKVDVPTKIGKGKVIVCLTNYGALKKESDALDHCVGRGAGYASACLKMDAKQRSHIFSIRDESGRPTSTIELRLGDGEDGEIIMSQHQAFQNKTPSREDINIASWFKEKIESLQEQEVSEEGEMKLNSKALQDQEVDASAYGVPSHVLEMGNWPSEQMVNNNFKEFLKEMRRASVGRDDDDKLMFPARGSDEHADLIQGELLYVGDDGAEHMVDARDLNGMLWVRATGLEEHLKAYIREQWPTVAKKCEAAWQEEPSFEEALGQWKARQSRVQKAEDRRMNDSKNLYAEVPSKLLDPRTSSHEREGCPYSLAPTPASR